MTSGPPASLGLIGNAVAGWEVARVQRRPLAAVLLPVLTAALLGLFALDLAAGRNQMVIVDGAPVVRVGGVAAAAEAALVAACWLTGLVAAVLVAVGGLRAHPVRPGAAIRAALRRLPVYALGLGAAAGGAVLLLRLAAGTIGLVVVLGLLAFAGVVAARLLIALLAEQFGATGWASTRGRVAETAGAFLLGGLAVPLGLAWLVAKPFDGGPIPPAVTRVVGAVVVTGVVAVQAGVLAHVLLLHRGGREAADLSAVDAHLAELSGPPPRRPRTRNGARWTWTGWNRSVANRQRSVTPGWTRNSGVVGSKDSPLTVQPCRSATARRST